MASKPTGDPLIAARLRFARDKAGYDSARDAYDDFDDWDVSYEGYLHHENGTRAFSISQASRYAKMYKVNLLWLAENVGPIDAKGAALPNPLDGLDPEKQKQLINYAKFLKGQEAD